MTKSIAILLISTIFASLDAQASELINDKGAELTRREAIVALAAGRKVFKLQEMTLGDKGTIHAIKKAGK